MNQVKLMRSISLVGLGLALFAGFFVPFKFSEAKVLYENSKIGTPYDLSTNLGYGTGYINIFPQATGTRPAQYNGSTIWNIDGEPYEGVAEWFRVKRISGQSCESPLNLTVIGTNGVPISDGYRVGGVANGPNCDYQMLGPVDQRTNRAVGFIILCLNNNCDPVPMVLDGSPDNKGFVLDGSQTIIEPGGWAFQICDSGGCEGGFGQSTSSATSTGTTTATSTDPGTGTTTATSTATTTTATTTGASSVLFLPGIMGSRLYEESYEIGCTSDGGEVERWFSTRDCDQLRLITDTQGNNVYDVYTKDGSNSVIDQASILGLNLYKSFFNNLEQWKREGKINNYALVPYDWRLRLDDLLKAKVDPSTGQIRQNPNGTIQEGYLYKTLEGLAASSSNGKVMIVAHSNGGLLAKTFLATLQENNDPLLSKVDNLMLVASPQVGTPDTIMGMLHGSEIGLGGSVVTKQTSRTLLNTMPFGFHLLPNKSYFDSTGVTVDTPVISFEQGTATAQFINKFGQSITNATSMQAFMTIDSGRIRPETTDLKQPEVVPKYLFDNYTKTIDDLINTWVPPTTMQVIEIAGVGVETLSGVEYFSDKACIRYVLYKCLEYAPKLGMRPVVTIDGDATVVAPSALAMSETYPNVQRWWLNLRKFNSDVVFDRVHKDIFEVEDISNLISNTLFATTSLSYTYLTDTPAILPNDRRLTFTLHSPLDLSITDFRDTISSSTETIKGGTYRRYGEVQYISIPDVGNPTTVKLNGEATGSFTLEVATTSSRGIGKRAIYSAIPSSTSTKVELVVDTDLPLDTSPLKVDYDGNGTPEIIYDTKGEVVPVVTYTTLINVINSLPIKPLYKKLLIENAKAAEQYDLKSRTNARFQKLELLALEVLQQQVLFYERSKILTAGQRQELIRIINELSK